MSFETPFPPYGASDPNAAFINASSMELLLIEMVPMAYRLITELAIPGKDGKMEADDEEQKEFAFRRLETLGYRVGQGLVER